MTEYAIWSDHGRNVKDIEICGRCLVMLNHDIMIVARIKSDHGTMRQSLPPSKNPWGLRIWAEAILTEGAVIDVGQTTGRFAAISTIYGDPVCEYHLWRLIESERKRLGGTTL